MRISVIVRLRVPHTHEHTKLVRYKSKTFSSFKGIWSSASYERSTIFFNRAQSYTRASKEGVRRKMGEVAARGDNFARTLVEKIDHKTEKPDFEPRQDDLHPGVARDRSVGVCTRDVRASR
eukprot:5378196-Pleurochrysis_carterae.AAC.1